MSNKQNKSDLEKINNLLIDKYKKYFTSPIDMLGSMDLYTIIQLTKPEYRLYIFRQFCELLSEEDYCFGLRTAYIKTAGINTSSAKLSLDEVLDLFKKANLKKLMGIDYKRWLKFPDIVTIYRATSNDSKKEGISWTIDRKRAIWFYKKYESKGTVLKAKIRKEDIICYLNKTSCFEKEVIVNYKNIFNMEELPKDEINKNINFTDLESQGQINTDYVVEASQNLLQLLANYGIIPTMELGQEVFKIYQTQGKYKSNYVLNFPSGEKITLSNLLDQINEGKS